MGFEPISERPLYQLELPYFICAHIWNSAYNQGSLCSHFLVSVFQTCLGRFLFLDSIHLEFASRFLALPVLILPLFCLFFPLVFQLHGPLVRDQLPIIKTWNISLVILIQPVLIALVTLPNGEMCI